MTRRMLAAAAVLVSVVANVRAVYDPNVSDWVFGLAIQNDGKAVIGGFFTNVNGSVVTGYTRLLQNGNLDTNFAMGANGAAGYMLKLSDGKIMVGGFFN